MYLRIPQIFFLLLFFWHSAKGQSPQMGMESPYDCVSNHLTHLNPGDYDPGQAGLSFYRGDSAERVGLAIRLKRVLDGKGLYVPVDRIPDTPNYIDSLTGQSRYILFPERLPSIYLEKIEGGWYYSPQCYDYIQRLYREVYPFGADVLFRFIPTVDNQQWMGLYLWQYIGLLLLLVVSLIVYYILEWLFKPVIRWISEKAFKRHLDLPLRYKKTSRVLSLLVIVGLLKYGIALLQLPIRWSSLVVTGREITGIVLWSLLIYRVFDIIMSFITQVVRSTRSKTDDQILPIIHQTVRLVIFIAAIIKILIVLDINVTALIAGISLGGLALALAAQDTLRNFIGSLLIFMDKPFQVEDWIELRDMAGTVVEVGFRSTRIQQLDTSIITIPNGIISNEALTNKGLRVFRLFEMTLGLAYDTPRPYLRAYIEGLRSIARRHPQLAYNQYIYLQALGSSSIDVLFRVFIKTNIYKEELQIKEELIFQMMELAEVLEVRFAFPSQTVYVEQLPGQPNLIPTYPASEEELNSRLEAFSRTIGHDEGTLSFLGGEQDKTKKQKKTKK